jgi:hypothetical protein
MSSKLSGDIRTALEGRSIEQIKDEDAADWRRLIQARSIRLW